MDTRRLSTAILNVVSLSRLRAPRQVYSLLVYRGPGAVPGIKSELAELLKTDGFSSVAEAVGADHRPPRKSLRK